MIPVTKPFLPSQEEYNKYLSAIWERQWLTNNGPLVNELELRLKDYLKVKHLLYVSNGTLALQIAIKALDLKGEIITTPFSFSATTGSIVWEGCEPVFVDIDADTLNIDPTSIEAAITPKTTAILATHVYGNACDINSIDSIAKKYNLKVIYDAAHCFGVKYKGQSIFNFGDISTTSFHATKLFHTIEGGALVTNSPELTYKMSYLRSFGNISPEEFAGVGTNAKNSEFHAAMGLCVLERIDQILNVRKVICERYNLMLSTLNAKRIKIQSECSWNHSYFPIIFETEEALLKALKLLNDNKVYPRRYFYPSLNTLPFLKSQEMPIAESVSKRILCLPLYHTLNIEEVDFIARLLLRAQNN
ncbi:DegT/DnrJ/EryC1/StrS family aminotransferase [Pontibacter sp. JH31]|uniref:DegT/DnrJ/EryC1/StrS family aminotransferase n=1 Tax=Pontibacter aquaedesilientis TaxID=2766980 RepID=A0ABR7XG85_9BACT|nr:DegT/DnrJ/EryC1/StrS family aminotransferase [Pontibacter aquaedesilientis]MBD1396946.1 DegT/DnrJ/EryC1/StrS family aminotransferase [Pontibacter aquaedesilientis]